MTTKGNAQTLHLGGNEPINLVTPLGVVRLDRNKTDHRKIDFTFPPIQGFKAFKGDKPEVKTMPLVSETDGHLDAQFNMLVPIRNSDGHIIGVRVPEVFCLVEEKPEDIFTPTTMPGVSAESPEGSSDELQPVSDMREVPGSDKPVGGFREGDTCYCCKQGKFERVSNSTKLECPRCSTWVIEVEEEVLEKV